MAFKLILLLLIVNVLTQSDPAVTDVPVVADTPVDPTSTPNSDPVPTDSQPVPPNSDPVPTDSQPVPPNSDPVPTDSQHVPPNSDPVPTDSQPVPPDSGPVPPVGDSPAVPSQPTPPPNPEVSRPVSPQHPMSGAFDPNAISSFGVQIVNANSTIPHMDFELEVAQLLTVYNLTSYPNANILGLDIQTSESLSKPLCSVRTQQLQFKTSNMLSYKVANKNITQIPSPTPSTNLTEILNQILNGSPEDTNQILDFIRVDDKIFYLIDSENNLYHITLINSFLTLNYKSALLNTSSNEPSSVKLAYNSVSKSLYLLYRDIGYLVTGGDGAFVVRLLTEWKVVENLYSVFVGKDNIYVSGGQDGLLVYELTSGNQQQFFYPLTDGDTKLIDQLNAEKDEAIIDVRFARIRGPEDDKLIVLDQVTGLHFFRLDYTNSASIFTKELTIDIQGAVHFDEIAGRMAIIVVDRIYYSYAVEYFYDLQKQTSSVTNVYWNDGMITQVHILQDFAILTGVDAHQIIMHSQQTKKQTKTVYENYFPDLQLESEYLGASNFFQFKGLMKLGFYETDFASLKGVLGAENTSAGKPIPVVVVINRDKIQLFPVKRLDPFIYCYTDEIIDSSIEFQVNYVTANTTNCPEKHSDNNSRDNPFVICQYKSSFTLEVYEAFIKESDVALIAGIVIGVICLVIIICIVIYCCIRKNRRKEYELDQKLKNYQEQRDHNPSKDEQQPESDKMMNEKF